MSINITEDGLQRKLEVTSRRATATFSRTQILALLELVGSVDHDHSSLVARVRELSRRCRVTLNRDEVRQLLMLALRAKQQSWDMPPPPDDGLGDGGRAQKIAKLPAG